jgi:archaeosine synthase beta-subunit
VLVGAPFVEPEESVEWTVRTAEYAARCGATRIALIPVRGGNGEMERLAALGRFVPPGLSQLEAALDRCLDLAPVLVAADLWDIDRLPACAECRPRRIARLRRLNLSGGPEARVVCHVCGAS